MGATCEACNASTQTMPDGAIVRKEYDEEQVASETHSKSAGSPAIEDNTLSEDLASQRADYADLSESSDDDDDDWAPAYTKFDMMTETTSRVTSAVDGILECQADSYRLRDEANDILDVEARAQADQIDKMDTTQLGNLTEDLFADIGEALLQTANAGLPQLTGWMFYFVKGKRRRPMMAQEWLKRFVVLSNGFMMWSERQLSVPARMDDVERRRWAKCVPMSAIQQVKAMRGVAEGGKFKMTFEEEGSSIQYLWRTDNKEERNTWVRALRKHVEVQRKQAAFNSSL